MYSSTTDPNGPFISFANAIGSTTGIGNTFIQSMINVPFQIFNTYIDEIILVSVFLACLSIGWGLWRRFV